MSTAVRYPLAVLLISQLWTSVAWADVKVEDAWVRAAVPGQAATGAFMVLTADQDSQLLQADSEVAKDVQIHETLMKDDVMRMQQVKAINLPAKQPVALDPHGYHIMLMGLNRTLSAGDTVPITLIVKDGGGQEHAVEVQAPVMPLDAIGAGNSEHSHQGH